MTVQIFDATVQDNRHVNLRQLKQGEWTTIYLNLARETRRNDGSSGSPFAAGHNVDDLFFFLRPAPGQTQEPELFLDEVVLFDAGDDPKI